MAIANRESASRRLASGDQYPRSARPSPDPDSEINLAGGAAGSRFELTPQKLVYGGAALGYHEGRPVLVAGALPGERVEAEALRQNKGIVHARVVRVIEPSPNRAAPPCPYVGRCGGCHYQHLDPNLHHEAKREILRETLRRIGRVDWPGEIQVHAADPWRYRNQVRLQIGPRSGGAPALGFREAHSHRLAPVDTCLLCSPRIETLIERLSRPEWLQRLEGYTEVELFADDRDDAVLMTLRGASRADAEALAGECLASLPGVKGVHFASDTTEHSGPRRPKRAPRRETPPALSTFGATRLSYRVGEFEYGISPGAFFQASRVLLPDFVNAVTSGEGVGGRLALDLYAGVGLFTLPLARRFNDVVAVELEPRAAADLARNVRAAGQVGVRAVASSAAEMLRRYAQSPPDLVVLDPPRAGAEGGVLRRLHEIGARRLHYASCQPPTLARDLGLLLRYGYRLESVEMFELFPQTFHIEALVKLRRD